MHISEGYLPTAAWMGSYAVTGLTTWFSLRQIHKLPDPSAGVPKAALLTAAFFIASSIKIPLPPSSVHLLLYGLLGITLGYYAFPALLVGLFLQAVIFQHGGLTTLGINAAIAGLPTLLFYHVFQLRHARFWRHLFPRSIVTSGFGFLAGFGSIALAVALMYVVLIATMPAGANTTTERANIMSVLVAAHMPLMLLEGVFTAMVASFLERVYPSLLQPGRWGNIGDRQPSR
ncbi:cobalamin (vitamin B12) biosynthesis CbiM protein [Thalassoporum mexicanum PCC 7367]|uniref:cobalt transporter CbiM n=1 Tax=Thalassoporum mexicanum TaxID=3457544 RepID=UPI00029FB094|nr:cobalt transporter CbiM [Pseudanabaena sp. PCC 7367]AFY71813.1 cobalamin (vitamin B12) biosynthesis CbiM protein [Pseudanabaena sp. PCC 7367]